MTHLEKAKALRADTQTHYNCAQSVLLAFEDRIGLTEEQAFQVASHFGAGGDAGAHFKRPGGIKVPPLA